MTELTTPSAETTPTGAEETTPTGADWLPTELRDNEGLKKFHEGGVPALANSYLSLEKAFAGKIPGADSTPEQVQAFYGPLGVPETAEGYAIKKPSADDLPDNVQWSDDQYQAAAAHAHKAHLTNDQFQAMVDLDTQRKIDASVDSVTARKAVIAENTASLQKIWGAAYDSNVHLSSLATKTLAPQELWDKMEKEGLTSDPLVIQLMNIVGQGMQEGKRIAGDPSADLTLTPEAAAKEQSALATDKDHPMHQAYTDRKHPDHKKAVAEFARLSQLKRGKTPAQ